ncbi:MAG: OmpP1/FadL family transporter, partial [Gemmatimonadaceae bacterium]
MSLPRQVRWLAVIALCSPSASLSAQGFGLNEIGTCAVARGFAVTGATCDDASVIFWNPAATAELATRSISLGANAIIIKGGFTQDTSGIRYPSNIQPALVPSFFGNVHRGRVAIGLGVYVPYGLTSQWYDNFPGRFSALKAKLTSIYVQPNVAYQLNNNWSIGGGPVLGNSTVELTQALDLSQQVAAVVGGVPISFGQLGIANNTEFGRVRLKGSSHAVGYNVGIHGKYNGWSIGGRYLSALGFHYSGADATFTQTATGLILAQNNPIVPKGASAPLDLVLASQFTGSGALTNQFGDSRITDPWQAQAGIGYSGFAGTTLSADIVRIGWSKFGTLPVT